MTKGSQAVHHLFAENGRAIGERLITGRYWLQKWNGAEWRDMSCGDARPEAGAGHELDHMIRQARVIGGRVRIVQNARGGHSTKVVWPESEARGA